MCGIAGIFNVNGEPVSHRTIKAMTDAIAHRGPDGEGQYVDVNIALGHRRLSIIDLSPAGHQPMASEDGNVIVSFNGEIYNFQELRIKLEAKGHQFHSHTDTEVLIHGFEEEGINFVHKLNGMFAFALWDARKRQLFLVRDRYGIKPLYFWYDGTTFLFASEIKAILKHPKVTVDIDYNALNEYFTFQNLFRYHTLYKGIGLIPAASIRTISQDNHEFKRDTYWDYDFSSPDMTMSMQDAQEETLRLFKQAVVRQLISDVPVGSYLSGGMDSGAVVSVASGEIHRLSTFTCGFMMHTVEGVEAEYDERKDAELMANYFKTEHYEQVIGSGDLSWALPKVIWHMEDLRVGMSYSNYYISRLASKFVKVCLSGAGGDELYGGYPWRYYRIFKSIDQDTFFKEYYNFWQRLVVDDKKTELFTKETWAAVEDKDVYQTFKRVFTFNDKLKYATPENHIENSMYFEIKTFLQGLLIVGDKLSMANSLEERVPFLDNDLVDFAMKIPVRHKLGNLEQMKRLDENTDQKARVRYRDFDDGKNVLRKSLSGLIPQEIINRKKQGFSSPDESWYRGENIEYIKKSLLNPRAYYREFVQPAFVKTIIDEHCDKRINHRLLIWSFLCFEEWCKQYLFDTHK